jgi:CheY-like chemotaxis protein
MVSAHHIINARLYENKLPSLDFRISADYGSLSIAKIASSASHDLFGSSMNICSKINSKASTNGIVIGQELYRYLSHEDYVMKEVGSYGQYSIYSVTSRHERRILNPFKRVSEIQFSRLSTPDTKLSAASIILIDDEPDTLFTFKSFLAKEGYNVEEFMDSKQALQYIEKMNLSYYDLVITDIKMPTFNGLELYQRIRAINTTTKVLFVTAIDATDILVNVYRVSPNDIIRKPIDEEHFIEKVKSTLAG